MKGLKRIIFFLTLLIYVFMIYLVNKNVNSCSESFPFLCSTNLFDELRIIGLLFSPLLLFCVLYDIYFILSLIDESRKETKENSNNKESKELIIDEENLK